MLLGFREGLFNAAWALPLLAAIFIPLERAFTARPQGTWRRESGLDLAFFLLQYVGTSGIALAFNAALQDHLIGWPSPALVVAIHHLPSVVQLVVAVFLGDLLLYGAHRLSHEVPLLWRFHSVHHSVQTLDWLAAHREHPLDGLYSQLALNLPAALLGVNLEAFAPVFVIRGLWAVFIHSNVRLPLGPLGLLLGDPVLHRWHHARVERCRHNFANVAPYLDVLFGTHFRPEGEDFALGLPNGSAPLPTETTDDPVVAQGVGGLPATAAKSLRQMASSAPRPRR